LRQKSSRGLTKPRREYRCRRKCVAGLYSGAPVHRVGAIKARRGRRPGCSTYGFTRQRDGAAERWRGGANRQHYGCHPLGRLVQCFPPFPRAERYYFRSLHNSTDPALRPGKKTRNSKLAARSAQCLIRIVLVAPGKSTGMLHVMMGMTNSACANYCAGAPHESFGSASVSRL